MTSSAKRAGIIVTGILGSTLFAASAQASTDIAQRQADWRAAIARVPAPASGCFTAAYPLTVWKQVACVKAPNIPYIPAMGGHHGAQTTGDGNDYAAVTKTLTQAALGSFPKTKHLTSETDGGANVYSIQLNSNFMSNDQACASANNPANCLGWLQYVYSSSEHAAFMQYWLIHYTGGTVHCPSGWNTFSNDCWKNGSAVGVPQEPITDLKQISLSGSAVAAGNDNLTFTDGGNAYNTSGSDNVMYLADGWTESEFNVIGDGGGSEATFNTGASLTVKIALTDGNNKKPGCAANHGTTGETNNLNLGTCKAVKGKDGNLPYVQFTESD